MVVKTEFKEETLNAVFNQVTAFIEAGMLHTPDDYSVANALRHAWFKISDTKGGKAANWKMATEICERTSIANSLLKMVTDGLTPAKNQCSFVIRKNGDTYNLDYQQEYQGKIALAKRYSGVQRVDPEVIYQDDEYLTIIEDGVRKVVKHVQPIENIDFDKIRGAYAVVTEKDGTKKVFEMSFKQIQTSWGMGAMNGEGDVHKQFADEMCRKTIASRACKGYINSSNDAAVIPELGVEKQTQLGGGNVLELEPLKEPLKLQPNAEFEQPKEEKPEVKEPEKEDNPY